MNTNPLIRKAAVLGLALVLLAGCGGVPAEPAAQPEAPVEPAAEAEVAEEPEAPPPEPQPESPPPEPEPEVPPVMMAAAPPESERNLQDTDASVRAYEKRALDGDNLLDNLFERPFTSQVMDYLPDVDIFSVDISQDEDFFYFTINLNDIDPASGKLVGAYGIEFDRTQTGRGDLLVLAHGLQPEWTSEGVAAFIDPNKDVGGLNPTLAEEGYEGNGYEERVAFEGERVAHARLHPEDLTAVQIAVSRALMDDAEDFLYGGWAFRDMPDLALFDFNDNYRRAEAGSPIKGDYYPLQELHSLDNTCRLPYGMVTGIIPGMCISIPAPEPGKHCVLVCTQTPAGAQGPCYYVCD